MGLKTLDESGKAGVTSYWNRFNFRIKHQLYLRILPVVALSVLAVGAFSGRLLTNRAVRTYIEQETLENEAALRSGLGRLNVQALSAEVEVDENLARKVATAPPAQHRALTTEFLRSLLTRDGVCGAAVLRVDAACRTHLGGAQFDAELDAAAGEDTLRAWTGDAWRGFARVDWADLVTGAGWPGGPRMVPVDNQHTLWIFPPIALPERAPADELAAMSAPRQRLALPVTVHEELRWSPDPETRRGRMHIVLLLEIDYLFKDWFDRPANSGELQVALDSRGRLLSASVDTLPAGMDLTVPGQTVFRNVRAAELDELLHRPSADGTVSGYLGSRLNPHAFLLAKRPELPLVLVSALSLAKINGGLVLYTAIIVLMVSIALLGSILAITSVGERLSNRLQSMALNMEEVAKGDFTRRMGVGNEDEVGRLISFFNQMTADLDEAHRQLSDKTSNLRVALEKMQRLDKAKDDFLALISHEVRTPLTSIIGGIDYLRVVLPGEGSSERALLERLGVVEIVDIVESSGRRLSEFMNDAILMASLQSADVRFSFQPAPIGDMCGMILSSLQETIAAKRLTVENRLADARAWLPLCDRELMTLALGKLLRNAVQHNFDDGRILVEEVEEIPGLGAAATAVDEKLREEFLDQFTASGWPRESIRWRGVRIFNTGPVIPLDRREALFTKFELVGRIEHHQKGSGLSLPIVRGILENHAGKIHVESLPDEGNSFYLILPTLADAAAADAGDAADLGDQQGEGLGGVAGHEEAGAPAGAALEVELEDVRA